MRIPHPLHLVLFFAMAFNSCQNDQLFDEREVFIGTWNWSFSQNLMGCNPVGLDTIRSDTFPASYAIEISKREKAFLIQDGEVQSKLPIFVSSFGTSSVYQNGFSFSIYFDEDNPELVLGHIEQDSFRISSFWPDVFIIDACNEYSHHFVRVE